MFKVFRWWKRWLTMKNLSEKKRIIKIKKKNTFRRGFWVGFFVLTLIRNHKQPVEENPYHFFIGSYRCRPYPNIATLNRTSVQVYCSGDTELLALKKVRLENEKEGFPITAVRNITVANELKHHEKKNQFAVHFWLVIMLSNKRVLFILLRTFNLL